MVALCGGCNFYEPWAALIVGSLGGLGYITVHFSMLRLRLDDPLDAVAVHGAGGLIGILCVPWFMVANLQVWQNPLILIWKLFYFRACLLRKEKGVYFGMEMLLILGWFLLTTPLEPWQ